MAQEEHLLLSGPADVKLEDHLVRAASLKAQPQPRGQTTWSTALSWLNGPSDNTTRLGLFCCTASTVVTKAQTFTHCLLT